jgi:hypothetical protein
MKIVPRQLKRSIPISLEYTNKQALQKYIYINFVNYYQINNYINELQASIEKNNNN